eukprot:COSAG06_NODE_28561_length_572_cov_0.765328_1_plen_91_part_10
MSSMRGGLLMILAIAFTRAGAEYRCHHNIGQDYCAKVSAAPLLLLLLACSLLPAPCSLLPARICPLRSSPRARSGSGLALTAAALPQCAPG